MTEKLFYKDSKIFAFEAICLSCEPAGNGFVSTLDRTAFFPEGGGQLADTGYIGNIRVTDVHEKGGQVLHYSDKPLNPGEHYSCGIDSEQRLRRMQNHSGEHIVSGLIHAKFGYDNVGFHMGDDFMTIDFNGEISEEELNDIEQKANEAIRDNRKITAEFPSQDELQSLDYRSKLELTENVRIVSIDGIDVCACCAPHMYSTGEVGIIKLLDSMRHRGGTRINCVCGMDAFDYFCKEHNNATEISRLLSSPRNDIPAYVSRKLDSENELKSRIAALSGEIIGYIAGSIPESSHSICIFKDELDEISQRELVNLLIPKTESIAAVFCGNDTDGYRYIMGSRNIDLRKISKELNAAINGRGGGKPEMISGRSSASKYDIDNYFKQTY